MPLHEQILLEYRDLDEVYFAPELLDKHYDKHVVSDEDGIWKMEYMSKEDYDELANYLSEKPAMPVSDISAKTVGYVTVDGTCVKYDKDTKLVVAYTPVFTKSLYKQPYHKFIRKMNSDNFKYAYYRDILPNE